MFFSLARDLKAIKAVTETRCSCVFLQLPIFLPSSPANRALSLNLSTYILFWLESNCVGASGQVADCQTDEGDRLHGDEVGRRASGANNNIKKKILLFKFSQGISPPHISPPHSTNGSISLFLWMEIKERMVEEKLLLFFLWKTI